MVDDVGMSTDLHSSHLVFWLHENLFSWCMKAIARPYKDPRFQMLRRHMHFNVLAMNTWKSNISLEDMLLFSNWMTIWCDFPMSRPVQHRCSNPPRNINTEVTFWLWPCDPVVRTLSFALALQGCTTATDLMKQVATWYHKDVTQSVWTCYGSIDNLEVLYFQCFRSRWKLTLAHSSRHKVWGLEA